MTRVFPAALIAFVISILSTCHAGAADAATIIVVTSFPEELTTRYEREFERSHPQIHVQFAWKQSRDALVELTKPEQGGADIYWAPSPANFALLSDRGAGSIRLRFSIFSRPACPTSRCFFTPATAQFPS